MQTCMKHMCDRSLQKKEGFFFNLLSGKLSYKVSGLHNQQWRRQVKKLIDRQGKASFSCLFVVEEMSRFPPLYQPQQAHTCLLCIDRLKLTKHMTLVHVLDHFVISSRSVSLTLRKPDWLRSSIFDFLSTFKSNMDDMCGETLFL